MRAFFFLFPDIEENAQKGEKSNHVRMVFNREPTLPVWVLMWIVDLCQGWLAIKRVLLIIVLTSFKSFPSQLLVKLWSSWNPHLIWWTNMQCGLTRVVDGLVMCCGKHIWGRDGWGSGMKELQLVQGQNIDFVPSSIEIRQQDSYLLPIL